MNTLTMDAFHAAAVESNENDIAPLHEASRNLVADSAKDGDLSRLGFVDWGSWPPRGR